ncbi:MAG: Riboflavin synthase alpha chain [Peltula sp. TS41687]|nr:MAG: Riboflavin synthase alpha chain [Peltula sp. TS41687]
MFTGIVESIGTVSSVTAADDGSGSGVTMTIRDAGPILGDAREGDSISINGTCLTMTSFSSTTFVVGIAPETLRRTNLGSLQASSQVNLERAVCASTRMGGHFVQGHVDTVATIETVEADGEALRFRLRPRERRVLRYVVEKGYVALDGASLTVTRVEDAQGWFEVMMISYTREKIVTAGKGRGDEVNLEVDMMGKYVEKSIGAYLSGDSRGVGPVGGVLERMVERKMEEWEEKRRGKEGGADAREVQSTKQS